MEKQDIIYGVIGAILAIIFFAVIFSAVSQKNTHLIITSKEIQPNSGLQLCTSSVNTALILCENKNVAMSIYNTTQEQIDNFLSDCQDWKIYDSVECIGDRIVIKGGSSK